jgi:hypothetical protein
MAAHPESGNSLRLVAYEGMSACWLLANGLEEGGYLTCIDPFFNDMRPVFESNIWKKMLNQTVSQLSANDHHIKHWLS